MKDRILQFTAASPAGITALQFISSALVIHALLQDYGPSYWALSLFIYFLTGCLGITVTYHRFLSHRSFQMPRYLEKTFSLFGAAGGTGSPLGWVALHRAHHQYSDQKEDPHSPSNGKLQIVLNRYNYRLNKWAMRDMVADPFHRYLHTYYNLLILVWFSVLLCIGYKWMVFIAAVPIALQIWTSVASNCFNHWLGYRNFETNEKSTNNMIIALISWGEGWHNNHHRYPQRWNFSVKWWELDLSSYVIRMIRRFT